MLAYDTEPGLGWGIFKLSDDHPFKTAADTHDFWYNELIAGRSVLTLWQIDRLFLSNCRAIAALEKDPGDRERLRREAQILYLFVRAWAKTVRRGLGKYKPPTDPLTKKPESRS